MKKFPMKYGPVMILATLLAAALVLNGLSLLDLDGQVGLDIIPIMEDAQSSDPPPVPYLPPETPDAPPPPPLDFSVLDDPANSVVKVTNHHTTGSLSGQGVLVWHAGSTCILTSRMIFSNGAGGSTATIDGKVYPTKILAQDENLGVVALRLYSDTDFPTVELSDEPNIPTGETTTVAVVGQTYDVIVRQHVRVPNASEDANKDWLILDGKLPASATGAPICHGGTVAGLVIGLSSQAKTQAIALGPRALFDFADRVMKVPTPMPTEEGDWEDNYGTDD